MLRALARPLLASWFIYGGIESVLEPERRAALAAPVFDPMLKDMGVDDQVKTTDLVKAHGAATIGAATMLAVSRTPRTAALTLTGLSAVTVALAHPFWNVTDEEERKVETEQFLKNLALLGGVMLAATAGHSARHIARKQKHKAKAKEKAAEAKAKETEAKAAKKAARKKKRKADA
ncbi:DoxX family membrane protein [Demequina zhanjiangensis]|uniref:DoxX family membrane protein n=1 Tax=Demequina zhanjiangensis TaxID=3051659 RepID=A0ABT8FXS3_9MICO|nr:DoxX family membrane protein [Demequina sp. SYSU T00b26]MDN4471704.1 DoxX family membrane protein [Demequina sp. SYSU T00b26]